MKYVILSVVFFILIICANQISFADENPAPPENQTYDSLKKFESEPIISEIQEATIKYAEVHPDKIKEWRDAARKKALLPNVSVGLDRYVTDYWHWDAGTNPDTLQKGKDTVSWDLGDLIWNDDQTINRR